MPSPVTAAPAGSRVPAASGVAAGDGSGRPPRRWARWARWIAPVAVLALAAVLRLWALGRPDSLVFDELYYVRDAVSQLAHGFPTTWPDDDPAFGGERADSFSDQASTIAHPPLGKWLIALGIVLFGADTGWGWRSAAALAGVATVAVTMRLGWHLTRSLWIACLAGFLLAIDGVHVVLSRVGLLDGFLTLFVSLGALFVWRDLASGSTPDTPLTSEIRTPSDENPQNHPKLLKSPKLWGYSGHQEGHHAGHQAGHRTGHRTGRQAGRLRWRRPWLLAAGLTFGAAAAIKWSGLYPLAVFLIAIVVVDVLRRYRARDPHPLARGALQALITGAIALPAAAIAYLASWSGWIASPAAQNREPGEPWWVSLWQWHADALAWHSTLSAPHPYQANPLTWPLALRPTAMYEARWAEGPGCGWSGGCVSAVSPLPNALVTWGGVVALLVLLWVVARSTWIAARQRTLTPLWQPAFGAAAFVLVGYLSGWLPWVLTLSRSAVFQFYAVVLTPFAALALALVLGALAGLARAPAQAPGAFATSLPAGANLLALGGIRLDASPEALQGRRVSVAIFLAVALALAILFFPVWSGMPVAEWFWRAHLWLPGWD